MASPDRSVRPISPPDFVIRYGDHTDQVIDVRSDMSRPDATVIILLHGGFWRARYDRLHTRPMADELARQGYVVCTPEYRRVGQAGGGHPGTFDDVAAAVDAILADPPATGGVVIAGHSAGGHLALWSAMRHRLPATSRWHASPKINGCVALAPVADLGWAIETGLGAGACAALLGGQLELLPETDPMRLLPYGPGAPLVLVHGTEDAEVPISMSRRFAERAETATLIELAGVEHFGLIDPGSRAWPSVLRAIRSVASQGVTAP